LNTASSPITLLAALWAATLLGACSLDQLSQGLSVQPAKTVIAAPVMPSKLKQLTTIHLSGTPDVTQPLGNTLASRGYVIKNDATLAVFHITTAPTQGISEESTSAPLMGILRKNTSTATYEIPFTIKDAIGNTLHSGNVVGFGDEDAGIYPRASSTSASSASKAKSDALAQLPEAVLQVLPNLPWRAQVIGAQDAKTVMLGLDASAGVEVGQTFSVLGKSDSILRITGFGPYGRALATPEKGPVGQLVEPLKQ